MVLLECTLAAHDRPSTQPRVSLRLNAENDRLRIEHALETRDLGAEMTKLESENKGLQNQVISLESALLRKDALLMEEIEKSNQYGHWLHSMQRRITLEIEQTHKVEAVHRADIQKLRTERDELQRELHSSYNRHRELLIELQESNIALEAKKVEIEALRNAPVALPLLLEF